MFPKWEFDVEDTPAENIIKLMFVKKPWKWTMDCWEVTAKKKVVKEDSPSLRKKARKEAPAKASEEPAAEATVDKKVGITTKRKGTSSQNTTSPPKPTLEPGID
ncbi:BnaCnng70610D [Brassica napus]|uniref:BnaCnng70610D protein n=1 Tax=Brassica napus TaxID=3708 RepID=A0A078JZG1_BRANA|nr:BnaCnng70610D [Brassica napus]